MDWEKFRKRIREYKDGTYVMVLKKYEDQAIAKIQEASRTPERIKESVIMIESKAPDWKAVLKSIYYFLTPHGGEIFEWVPPKREMVASGSYLDQVELNIFTKDIEKQGYYDTAIIRINNLPG